MATATASVQNTHHHGAEVSVQSTVTC
jgi:hypothetical protein